MRHSRQLIYLLLLEVRRSRDICKIQQLWRFLCLFSLPLFQFVGFVFFIFLLSPATFSLLLSTHLLLFFSFLLFKKIHFSGIQITNEVVDVEAALKSPEWASRTPYRWRREVTLVIFFFPFFFLLSHQLLNNSKIYYAILRCLGWWSDVILRNTTTVCRDESLGGRGALARK